MENVTPMPAINERSTRGQLDDCFEEAKALADVI